MKPRSDAKLKNLPEEMQEAIIAWANTPKGEDHPGGLAYAREQLAADGIKVSLRAVSEFVAWWQLRQRFAAASSRSMQIEEMLLEKAPNMSPEKIRAIGQALFTLEAIDANSPETYVALENLQLNRDVSVSKHHLEQEKLKLAKRKTEIQEERVQLEREKFERVVCEKVLDLIENTRAKEISTSTISRAEKIKLMRAEFFRDVDELEASGGVVLPE